MIQKPIDGRDNNANTNGKYPVVQNMTSVLEREGQVSTAHTHNSNTVESNGLMYIYVCALLEV